MAITVPISRKIPDGRRARAFIMAWEQVSTASMRLIAPKNMPRCIKSVLYGIMVRLWVDNSGTGFAMDEVNIKWAGNNNNVEKVLKADDTC